MNRGLASAVVLALTQPGDGQFLRSSWSGSGSWSGGLSFSSSLRTSSWTNSFTTSSFWTRGSDGELHQQVQQAHTEVVNGVEGTQRVETHTVQNENGMQRVESNTVSDGHQLRQVASNTIKTEEGTQRVKSRTICADGLCAQETHQTVKPAAPAPSRLPTRVQAMLERMFGPQLRGVEVVELPAQRPQPSVVIAVMPSPAMRGSSRWAAEVQPKEPEEVPTLPPTYEDAARHAGDFGEPSNISFPEELKFICFYYCGSLVAMLSTFLLLSKACSASTESARVPQLVNHLAEPFAPAEEAPRSLPAAQQAQRCKLPSAEEVASAATQEYLVDLYARAQEQVDKRSIRQYMCALYQKVAA